MNPILSDNQILSEGQLKKSMADFSGLVVRGNPRNALACSVEFPFADVKSSSSLYMERARTKRRYTQAEQLKHRHEKRSTLYGAMATAGKILPNYVNKKGETRQHSTCLCRRYMQTHENAKGYVVLTVDDNHIAKLTGTITCDNPWVCSVCSSIQMGTRAKEITNVQKNFLAAGRDSHWSTWMLTLTIPHTRADQLDDLLTRKSAVMSDFHAHSTIKKLKARIGWKGYVDSLEIRRSNGHGWHPHHHILGFFTNMHPNTRVQCVYDKKRGYYRIATQKDKVDIAAHKNKIASLNSDYYQIATQTPKDKKGIKSQHTKLNSLYKRFFRKAVFTRSKADFSVGFGFVALRYIDNSMKLEKITVQKYIYSIFAYLCVKHGLKRPSEEHGVDFRKSDDIQDYLTKQSKIAHELTAEHDKKSTYSRSQWEILRDCESDNDQLASYSKSLFCEFAAATKGKAKLHWSPNFKELWLDIDDDDIGEGVAVDDDDLDSKIYKISYELWNRFFTAADRVHQRQLLEIAELDSLNGTSNTEIHLYALSQILKNEKIAKRAEYEAEQDRLYEEWRVKIPDSHYEQEDQRVYDYHDFA